jgi:hypothetical protein
LEIILLQQWQLIDALRLAGNGGDKARAENCLAALG